MAVVQRMTLALVRATRACADKFEPVCYTGKDRCQVSRREVAVRGGWPARWSSLSYMGLCAGKLEPVCHTRKDKCQVSLWRVAVRGIWPARTKLIVVPGLMLVGLARHGHVS